MPFPVPSFIPSQPPLPAAEVRSVVRADAMWDRPVFKAPPLERYLQGIDARRIAQELRSIGLVQR